MIGRNMALFTLSTLAIVLAVVEILRLSWRVLDRRGGARSCPNVNSLPRCTPHEPTMPRRREMDAEW